MTARSTPPDAEWLTVADIATRMRVSKMTVYRMIDTGELPCIQFGRSFRIRATTFEALLAKLAEDAAEGVIRFTVRTDLPDAAKDMQALLLGAGYDAVMAP